MSENRRTEGRAHILEEMSPARLLVSWARSVYLLYFREQTPGLKITSFQIHSLFVCKCGKLNTELAAGGAGPARSRGLRRLLGNFWDLEGSLGRERAIPVHTVVIFEATIWMERTERRVLTSALQARKSMKRKVQTLDCAHYHKEQGFHSFSTCLGVTNRKKKKKKDN